MKKLKVVNKYTMGPEQADIMRIYIGRGSGLGNPWPITKTDSRDAVCDRFAEYLAKKVEANDPSVCAELNRIVNCMHDFRKVELVCFCAPRRCHGESIRDTIHKALGI